MKRKHLSFITCLAFLLSSTEGFVRLGHGRHSGLARPGFASRSCDDENDKGRSAAMTPRRDFLLVAAASVVLLPASAALADSSTKGAPGNVVGKWDLTQLGVKQSATGTLSFDKSGETSLVVGGGGGGDGGTTFLGATGWKVNPARRFPNDPGRRVRFNIEYGAEVLAYTGIIEESAPDVISGTVEVEEEGGEMAPDSTGSAKVGTFEAKLLSAAEFAKKRGAFQYDLDPNAPVLELNGRARWVVEKENLEKRRAARQQGTQPVTTRSEEQAQSGVYMQNPVKLVVEQGYKVQEPEDGAVAPPAAAAAAE